MTRRRSVRGLLALFTLGMAYLALSLDWRGRRPPSPPRVAASWRSTGAWSAGAAKVDLAPLLPATVAGYPPWRPTARESGPLFARALILGAGERKVGIISAEVLEVPEPIARQVRAKGRSLGLDEVAVAATHSHSSFGGYDRNLVAQVAGTGRFDAAMERHLAGKLEQALEAAQRAMEPAKVQVALAKLPDVSANRHGAGGPVDDQLSALAVNALGDKPVARVVIFGSHPTLMPRATQRLDGDWPGRAMARLEEDGSVALLLQGALGDVTSRPPTGEGEPAARMGIRVAQVAAQALQGAAQREGSLASATVVFDLPRADADHAVPGILKRPAANGLQALSPSKAEITVVRVPGLAMLFMPAEPTAGAAAILRERLAPLLVADEALAIVALAQGDLGYLETPSAVREGRGEAVRTVFGPEFLERIAQALMTGLEATRPAPPGR